MLAGCVGAIEEPSEGGGPGGPGSGGVGGGGPGTNPADPRLEARVWRLTPDQYNTEVQRLFPGAPFVDLPTGSSEYGITNIAAAARIDLGNASQFTEAARQLGTWAADQGASAARCSDFGTAACIDTFLDWFPEAAYRRPLTDAEKTALRGVYDDTASMYDTTWGFSAVVRAVLLSPQFLYRPEIGVVNARMVGLATRPLSSNALPRALCTSMP